MKVGKELAEMEKTIEEFIASLGAAKPQSRDGDVPPRRNLGRKIQFHERGMREAGGAVVISPS